MFKKWREFQIFKKMTSFLKQQKFQAFEKFLKDQKTALNSSKNNLISKNYF